MDRDDLIKTVTRLEAVADRFEAIVKDVAEQGRDIASLKQSRASWYAAGRVVGAAFGSLVVGLLLVYLVGKGRP